MPTYEYVCGKCGHEFERFHSILAEPVKKCPECGKNAVTRKIGMGGGVLFKGGGFYETDYRSEGYTKAAEAEKGEAKAKDGGEGKKDGKGEAKPETKPDAKPEPKPESKPAPKPEAKSEPSSNATHRSRVGRGIGNILQNPPKPKPAPKAKPAGKSRRK
jgi:putative FmdB family regulatory protein